ncbi:chemocyanin-like [Rutidosis leptorrhynchoides]|uniref:chemocyanin-like n=1 Tax=Rutidosis leptorrhynchoides TaxID=125765 RepID=UPI003A9A2115
MASAMMLKFLLSIVVMLFELALAVDHTVGGSGGWDTSTNFASWASGETFNVGDNLVFNFLPNHSVLEVSKDDYDSCTTSNPISTNALTPVTVTLTAAGSRYFICGTPGHCDQGMKVEIDTVSAASSAPPPTTTSTPPSSDSPPPTTATPPPSTTTTPPPSSNSPPPSVESPPPSFDDSPAPPVTSNGPTISNEPAKPSPSSATTLKLTSISMGGIGFFMMI